MKRWVWIAWIFIALVVALPTMAWASPPDPTWIRGIYDDADFDDVVIYLTSSSATAPALSVVELVPLLALVEMFPCLSENLELLLLSSQAPRAPPHA